MTESTEISQESTSNGESNRKHKRSRLLLPFACSGMIIAGVLLIFARPESKFTESQVRRQIRAIALHKSDRPGIDDGGPIGPCWIAASEADEWTGEFREFRIRTHTLRLAAERAKLIVDPTADTISFELWNVSYAVIPEEGRGQTDHYVLAMDHYVFGPTSLHEDIVADGEAPPVLDLPPVVDAN